MTVSSIATTACGLARAFLLPLWRLFLLPLGLLLRLRPRLGPQHDLDFSHRRVDALPKKGSGRSEKGNGRSREGSECHTGLPSQSPSPGRAATSTSTPVARRLRLCMWLSSQHSWPLRKGAARTSCTSDTSNNPSAALTVPCKRKWNVKFSLLPPSRVTRSPCIHRIHRVKVNCDNGGLDNNNNLQRSRHGSGALSMFWARKPVAGWQIFSPSASHHRG